MKKIKFLSKHNSFLMIFIFASITIYLYLNKTRYEQSEVRTTLKAVMLAEESFYNQYKRYADNENDLGISFNRQKILKIYFSKNNLPPEIIISNENIPYVGEASYRILVLFKASDNNVEIWRMDNKQGIQLINRVKENINLY